MDQGTAAEAPISRRHIIKRPRLTRLLDESGARVQMLIAPPGYGKTTLAREWLRENAVEAMWYRPVRPTGDVSAVALGLARAVEPAVPGIADRLRQSIRGEKLGEATAQRIQEVLLDELALAPEALVLAVDDYHMLAGFPEAASVIGEVASRTRVRLLVLSRSRPTWASARQILYGEIQELGPMALAMTEDEAAAVFQRVGRAGEMPGLVAVASGWPAVIGLAALAESPVRLSEDTVPDELHHYLAEELFAAAGPKLQERLAILSVAPTIDAELAAALFGEDGSDVLEAATELGFLNTERGIKFDLHPLLRSFLRKKLESALSAVTRRAAATCVALLTERGEWDEAYAVIDRFDMYGELPTLLSNALDGLLMDGRVGTVREWIDLCKIHGAHNAAIALAEAEVAFREARWQEAEQIAAQVAASLPDDDPIISRAYYRAGLSAHLNERSESALALHERARATASTVDDLRQALWGIFVAVDELEDVSAARAALEAFESLPARGVEDLMRRAQARLTLASRTGELRSALRSVAAWRALLRAGADPIVQTAYLNILTTCLSIAAQYEEALEAADAELRLATETRVDFVTSHAVVARATALLGMRRFSDADRLLADASSVAASRGDLHAEMQATSLRARLLLSRADADGAMRLTSRKWSRTPSRGMYADFLSTRALALAVAGRTRPAVEVAGRAINMSKQTEGRVLGAFAIAIAASRSDGDAATAAETAFALAASECNFDAFVCSYRAYPKILESLVEAAEGRSDLVAVLARRDPGLARKFGFPTPGAGAGVDLLTEREAQVLELIREGFSNREIARSFWIQETTAKVHVRHILRKLGVRTRTEAALMATKLSETEDDGSNQRPRSQPEPRQ